MAIDPIAQQWLDTLAAAGLPPMQESTPEAVRASRKPGPPGPEVHRVEDMDIAGPDGPIPVRIYWPNADPNLPILVWYHGGGWVIGTLGLADSTARRLCSLGKCIVISVDYRLAPEHPYPAGLDDSYAAVVWAYQNAKRFGGDSSRIAVGGDSAGGTLATVVAQMVRDRAGIPLAFQVLIYPVTDAAMDTESFRVNRTFGLTPEAMAWFYDHYVPAGVDRGDPSISPLRSKDLSGLPPAYVVTAECDPLRDEGNAYADALRAAGVEVDSECFAGQIHTFFVNAHAFPEGMRAVETAAGHLRRAFGTAE